MNFLNPIIYQLYNVILAFWPILWFGMFDTNDDPRSFYQNKELYKSYHSGRRNAISFVKYLTYNGGAALASFVNFYMM